jgi:hypothetical protein
MITRMQGKSEPDETACPLLGLATDRVTHFEFAAPGHRCWANDRAVKVEVSFQAAICVGSEFRDCVRHRLWIQQQAAAARQRPRIELRPETVPRPKGRPFLRNRLAANTERV